jgi:hypothetical protein
MALSQNKETVGEPPGRMPLDRDARTRQFTSTLIYTCKMAYRPPHMRAKAQPVPPHEDGQQAPAKSQPRNTIPPGRFNGDSSQARSANRPPSSIYPSPADRTRPSGRLAEVKLDPMELIQSVSRSGGDGAEGDA